MKILERKQFGDPILRKIAKQIPISRIKSPEIQTLIADMQYTLRHKKLGVGLAAPQVGHAIALAIVSVRPTKIRPEAKPFDAVLINPVILGLQGAEKQLWEGCISAGSEGKADLFAQVPRNQKVTVKYYDDTGTEQKRTFTGLPAQIIQHEVDHLNGVLFVDRVVNTESYMTYQQYRTRVITKTPKSKKV